MTIILGLDVSTSCTGVCIVDDTKKPTDRDFVVVIDRIEFKKCKTFWDKCDEVSRYLHNISRGVGRIVLEEPLMGFRPGMSSAQTISQLLRFNGIVSNTARKIFLVDPEYISANHARKAAGVKLQRTAAAGMSQKEQVFKHMSENDLSWVQWPAKKNGQAADWSRDATDAYVIAKAAALEGPIVPVKKARKSKKDGK